MITVATQDNSSRVLTNTATTSTDMQKTPPAPIVAAAKAQGSSIRSQSAEDNICILTFDRPDSSANVFDLATLTELNEHLDAIEKNPQIRGLVLISAKKSIFIAGADVHSLSQGADAAN